MQTRMNKTITPQMSLPKTKAEQDREQLHNRICSYYINLKSQFPDQSDNRLFTAIANQTGRTSQNVRDVLIKNQLYQPKARTL